ncbi:MAG: FlgD immunoglobulin-like domain containing protein [Candidatus Eisenbacteria bacterium]
MRVSILLVALVLGLFANGERALATSDRSVTPFPHAAAHGRGVTHEFGEDLNWQVLLSEGFEAGFPASNWQIYRRGSSLYRWDDKAFRPHGGTFSGWCVGSSENATEFPPLDPATDSYPNDVKVWMVSGPFDLSDAEIATVDFWQYLDLAPGDSLYYGVSTDGIDFLGYFESSRSGGYVAQSFDIGDAFGVSDLRDLDEVYVAFYFFSDAVTSVGSGVFLDDIVVRKRVPGPICRLSTDTVDFGTVPVDSSAVQSFTIFNDGDQPLIGLVSLSCADFTLQDDAAFSVGAGGSTTKSIRFTPSSDGEKSCLVSLEGTECGGVDVSGDGVTYQLPTLSHTALGTVSTGRSTELVLELQQSGTPPPGDADVTLHYLIGDRTVEPVWASRTMTVASATSFSATIPGADIRLFGSRYYFEYEQGGLRSRLPADALSTFELSTSTTTSQLPFTLPGGSEQSGYRMISVPGVAANRSVDTLLVDDFGAYDDTKWRFFRYESGNYEEYPDPSADELEVGKAYWVPVAASGARFDTARLTSMPLVPFEIELAPGWNDIANPFVSSIPTSAVSLGGDVEGPYAYAGSWNSPGSITTLEPWTGYSWFNPNGFAVTLAIDPVPAPAGALRDDSVRSGDAPVPRVGVRPDASWTLALAASAGSARDGDNTLGIAPDATAAKDPFDYTEPRMIGDGVRLAFEPTPGGGLLSSDYRPEGNGLIAWDVLVETRARSGPGASPRFLPVVVEFAPSGALPSGWGARVVTGEGPAGAVALDAARGGTLTLAYLESEGDLARGSFTVLAGPRELLDGGGSDTPAPEWSARSLGPNPFRDTLGFQLDLPESAPATVRIFDAAGRRAASLAAGVLSPGRHVLTWDGRDQAGALVPSGVYFWEARLGTRNFRGRALRIADGR